MGKDKQRRKERAAARKKAWTIHPTRVEHAACRETNVQEIPRETPLADEAAS